MPASPCILLAEDHEVIRRMMAMLLCEEGYTVLQARNGRVALALFQERRRSIKLLITDLSMPEMSGSELIAAVRKIAPRFPVLVCSSGIGSGPRHLEQEEIRYLEKPFPLETFQRMVREMWQAGVSLQRPPGISPGRAAARDANRGA